MTILEWLETIPDDWRDHYEERAAILEYCEGLDRGAAERIAFIQILRRMRAEVA